MIFLYISIGVLVIIFLFSFYLTGVLYKPNKFQYDETLEIEKEKGYITDDMLQDLDIEEVYVLSNKCKLHAHYINQNSDKTIIIMHGYTYTLYGSYKYAKYFIDHDYNVLMPDQRFHGLSEGKYSTVGYKEKIDLRNWIDFIYQKNPHNKVLGLHGESMGAATCLLEGHNNHIDFIISDCSFSSFKQQLKEQLSKLHIPSFFIYTTNLMTKVFYNSSLINNSPVDNLKNINAPILFIHGLSDTYIPINHFDKLTNNMKSYDMKYTCKNAEHAMSYHTDPQTYINQVHHFLSNIERDDLL